MGSLSSLIVLIFILSIFDPSQSLANLFGSLKNNTQSSGGADNLVICTIRYAVHHTRVYDTILVDKCHPTTTTNCHQTGGGGGAGGGGYGGAGGGGGQSCQTNVEKQCSSKMETVYENECTTEKDQSCTTVYDTTFRDKCQTEYVRVCGGFHPVGVGGGGHGIQAGAGYGGGVGPAAGYGGGLGGNLHGVSGPGAGPSGYGIHRRLTLDEEYDEDIFGEDKSEEDNQIDRKKRETAEERYGGGGTGCSKIPQQKCIKIPEKQPRRQCSTVDKPSCHSKPRQVHKQECSDVPKQSCQSANICTKEIVHKCRKVPRRVPRLVGHRVPKRHCERLNQDISGTGMRLVGVFNSPHGSVGGPGLGLGYYP